MLIDVTIDVRDLDPNIGPAPIGARVAFARLSSSVDDGVLVTSDAVVVSLGADGSGSLQLQSDTGYWVHCYGFNGFGDSFAVMTGTDPTSLGQLWQTGQIDPGDYTALPVPQTVEQALETIRADIAALQVGGGGGGGGLTVTPTGDGYLELTGANVMPTGDGYLALN